MAGLDGYSDAEIGRMVREAARGRENEAVAALESQYSLAEFFENVGLYFLAEIIWEAASSVYEGLKNFFRRLFW